MYILLCPGTQVFAQQGTVREYATAGIVGESRRRLRKVPARELVVGDLVHAREGQ
jgi:hypothetical protein